MLPVAKAFWFSGSTLESLSAFAFRAEQSLVSISLWLALPGPPSWCSASPSPCFHWIWRTSVTCLSLTRRPPSEVRCRRYYWSAPFLRPLCVTLGVRNSLFGELRLITCIRGHSPTRSAGGSRVVRNPQGIPHSGRCLHPTGASGSVLISIFRPTIWVSMRSVARAGSLRRRRSFPSRSSCASLSQLLTSLLNNNYTHKCNYNSWLEPNAHNQFTIYKAMENAQYCGKQMHPPRPTLHSLRGDGRVNFDAPSVWFTHSTTCCFHSVLFATYTATSYVT